MPTWIIYSLIATFFAGITAVLAKFGTEKADADLGLLIRTAVLFVICLMNFLLLKNEKTGLSINSRSLMLLVTTGITTAICWIFYYRALSAGSVSTVTIIDRGSIVVTLLLSATLLKEPVTSKMVLGMCFILAGLVIILIKN